MNGDFERIHESPVQRVQRRARRGTRLGCVDIDQRGNDGDENHRGEPPRVRIGRQAGDDVHDFHAIQPHDGEDRPELDHHRENAHWILESEQLFAEQQVGCRRHGQKFRQTLNDAKNRGEKIPYDALAFRCDFDLREDEAAGAATAGAAVDSFDGLVRRQKVTIAAATNTLE